MKKKMNALVVDDHKMVCDSIAALLEKSVWVEKAYVAYSGDGALEILKLNSIQLALIDARMPGMSGVDLMRSIRDKYPQIKTVAITSFDETATLKELLPVKTDGILLKRSTNESEINQCVQQLMEDNFYYSPEVLYRLKEIDPRNFSRRSFSKREKEIIQLMSDGKSTKEIAAELKLSVSTIEDYRKELLRKADVKNAAELIAYTYRNGLI